MCAMNELERRQLDSDVAGCALAHQRLLADLDHRCETARANPSAASLLPDWSIGHVLSHLARNADGFRTMIEGASKREIRPMYESAHARNGGIEAGASRSLPELVIDLRRSVWALESAWAGLDAEGWAGSGLTRSGKVPVTEFAWRRWREVEIHHGDLGLGFGPADWSPDYVRFDFPRRLAEWTSGGKTLPSEVLAGKPWQPVAWMFGRASGLATPAPAWV